MKDLLQNNWGKALGEVAASIVGALGFIWLVALALSGQNPDISTIQSFSRYFEGGQISLSILSVSGVAFIALLRHRQTHYILGVILLIILIGPIVATSIFVGMNPGFEPGGLSATILSWLWWMFFGLHLLWFLILLLEPALPNAQEAGEAQEKRVSKIKTGAAGRA
ncbi:hypothetical protein [Hoeflea sp.]|uniref:hypothetical protein n=1 Tax=Hoeflea sp. TaxID=1940281 RepID=UPI00199BDDD0|nr:hypothetical protein [Hoeflea sp.]MBC7286363.1 hypothetical protein [Hoeflea sp.]